MDSESIPDIEPFNRDDQIIKDENKEENKDILDEEDLELDEQAFQRQRRASSYEETIAGMDPELLKEFEGIEYDYVQTQNMRSSRSIKYLPLYYSEHSRT